MIQSRITSKAQTTIPAPVRKALGLREGDLVTYRIEEDRVVITRAEPVEDPFVTFTEWDSAGGPGRLCRLLSRASRPAPSSASPSPTPTARPASTGRRW